MAVKRIVGAAGGSGRFGSTGGNAPKSLLVIDPTTGAISINSENTHSRSSAAMVRDWEGIYRTASANELRIQGARRVENLSLRSEDFSVGAVWGQLEAYTITPAEWGLQKLVSTTNGRIRQEWAITSLASRTFVFRIKLAKAAAGDSTVKIKMCDNFSSGTEATITLTTTPTVYSVSHTFGAGHNAVRNLMALITATSSSGFLAGFVGVYELTGGSNTNPPEYLSTTTASVARYYYTTNGNTVSSNVVTEAAGVALHPTRNVSGVLCFDTYPVWTAGTVYAAGARVIPATNSSGFPAGGDGYWYYASTGGTSHATTEPTWAAGPVSDGTAQWTRGGYYRIAGYLHEQAATALNTYSNDLSNAAWAKTDCAVGTDSVVCPDGITRTTVTLTASAGNATCLNAVTAGNAAYVYAVSLKRKTGTGTINITVNGGTSWTSVTLTTAWQRFQVTATVTNPSIGVRIVTSGDAIYMAQSNVAAGTFATSPIDTTTAAVTRAADSLTLPASVFSNTAGTLVADVQHALWSAATGQLLGDGTEYVAALNTANDGIQSYDGANTATGKGGYPTGTQRVGSRWNYMTGKKQCSANGFLGDAGNYDGSFNLSSLIVGSSLNAVIRNFNIYKSDLGADSFKSLTLKRYDYYREELLWDDETSLLWDDNVTTLSWN